MQDLPRLPGVEYVCAGYDPFLGYANSENIVSSFFDWDKATQDSFTYNGTTYRKPAMISALSQTRTYLDSVTGEDIQTYQSSLAASVNISGKYNFFSGSLSTDFSQQDMFKSENSFSRTQQSVSTWSLQIAVTDAAREFLQADFKKALDNLAIDDKSFEKFFTTYGSHLLTGIVLGGRALRTASTNKYTVDRSYNLEVTAKEACKFASGNVDAAEKLKYQNSVDSFESKSTVIESVIGGNVVLAEAVFDSNSNAGGDAWRAWAGSVTKQPALVDFLGKSLTPIWELCATDGNGPKIRNGLQNYFDNTWAPLQSDKLTRRPDFIDALTVVTGDNGQISPPDGYTKIDADLNRGAKGKFIFAAYHKKTYNPLIPPKEAVTDIDVIYDNDKTPDGWKKISNDLNEGAKGRYIYLCYKVGPYDENTAILDMSVISSSRADVQPPYGYTKLDKDLNAGAGGDFIYFVYTKRSMQAAKPKNK